MSTPPPLSHYNAKRDFAKTPEPAGKPAKRGKQLSYVIQKHWATRLHYDFRLEFDGVLLSWAVPKGPSFDPKQKRMAIHVEDHPVSYGTFEGKIPEKQYGAGTVIVWDRGTWEPINDPVEGMKSGKVVFALHGEKLAGQWELIRIAKPGDRQDAWLLFKKRDAWARPVEEYDVVTALPDSIVAKPLGLAEVREPKAVESAPTPEPVVGKKARKGASGVPEGAIKAPMPASLSPQLATLAKKAPEAGEWLVEAKFDGYRMLARIEKGRARLITRNGNDWTDKLTRVAAAVESLGIEGGWLDGELVVLTDAGGQDFNALQNAIDKSVSAPITYFLFDAPFLGGYDLRGVPLWQRRAALEAALAQKPNDQVRFSQDYPGGAAEVLKAACAMKLEGVIVKRRDALYASTRNDQWIKLKCSRRQEFVIGGYTDRSDSTSEIGNLLLGVYEDGQLRYAGAVGTGWSLATARELKKKLKPLEIDRSPFETGSTKQSRWTKRTPGTERWVKPVLVAEATFAEWTPEGHLRHASFQGLREDKPAKSVLREEAVDPPADADATPAKAVSKKAAAKEGAAVAATKKAATTKATTAAPSAKAAAPAERSAGRNAVFVSDVKVSSPERVIDPTSGSTKLDLVRYYDSVAERILPHLADRPVSLVRGPSGVTGELFFQKHLEAKIAGITELDVSLWPEHASMMEIHTVEALLSAAQMNTIELHTWNAKTRAIDKPDRMIFDLDPGEGVTWKQVQEAATLTHAMLDQLGLVSFLKTSGGKGLHIVVPLTPRADWDTVKGFSQALVQHLARTIPDRFVAKSGGSNRIGKIFVDYIRNGLGATTAVAFSARARPGLGVSMPVAWDALSSLKSGSQWTIANAREYLSFEKSDPWADYSSTKQTLTAAMKVIGFKTKG